MIPVMLEKELNELIKRWEPVTPQGTCITWREPRWRKIQAMADYLHEKSMLEE